MSDATQLLLAVENGNAKAGDKPLPLVYHELCKLAAQRMARETAGHTLQPATLVHDVWSRPVENQAQAFENRADVFAAAAAAMRRILIARGRQKGALRHGGGQRRLSLKEVQLAPQSMTINLWRLTRLSTNSLSDTQSGSVQISIKTSASEAQNRL